ncbi:hypothetical protein QM012_009376 [Aureobasidium pullulans]|uniref:Zn(2)-C6 fungal-type domain-containing protein n=1 Tax=Aureobasidium pullulans TaxID=5580 RepID=A0ABR0TI64_AURPU
MAWPGSADFSGLHQSPTTTPFSEGVPQSLHQVQQQQQQQQQQLTPTSSTTAGPPRKRKKSEIQDDHSPQADTSAGLAKAHPVKRACNQCRQQKLRCNIQTEPEFQPCGRCIKHNLTCAIDPGFKRQEKRQRHAEMERELETLKTENANLRLLITRGGMSNGSDSAQPATFPPQPPYAAANNPFPGPNEAAASRSLLDLAQGGIDYPAREPTLHTLGRVTLTENEVMDLVGIYFARYHPYLPLLSPDTPYTAFFAMSPLLHWTILTIAMRRYEGRPGLLQELRRSFTDLMWSTIASDPQSYHIVKALVLICTWPMPSSSTSHDPSMMLCGTMVQLAMQFGLHRPSHAQDFSRNRIELREEDIQDRMHTWVAVNLIAQNTSTGYGMPQISRWNWYTHGLHLDRISGAFRNRIQIERFVDKVTRTCYIMQRDEFVAGDEAQRFLLIDTLGREYEELETSLRANHASHIDLLNAQIACLHLRLTAFFGSPSAPTYKSDLSALYIAATTLLKSFLALPPNVGVHTPGGEHLSGPYQCFATNYMMQMLLAAGFTLMKLLNSFFANKVDVTSGRTLFLQTVAALRNLSVAPNDLPLRLAEVLAQLWQANGGGSTNKLYPDSPNFIQDPEQSLQLKVRCRMSMSLLYDSVWRWKDHVGAGASKNLDRAIQHPTIPTAIPNAETSDALPPSTMAPDQDLTLGGLENWENLNFAANAPFDSLGWALDGFLDMPEGFMA